MKKSVLILIMLAGCLLLGSCAVSADQMLEDFNGQIYEDMGDGNYLRGDGEPSISTSIIKLPVYRIMEQSILNIEILKDFHSYNWTLTNNSSKREVSVGDGSYYLTLLSSNLNMKKGEEYTLKVIVKNRDGALLTDSAKIVVVENEYL